MSSSHLGMCVESMFLTISCELFQYFLCFRMNRGQSICDDTSSELQRMAAIERNSQSSFRGRGALSRIVSMVMTLREWAQKSLAEDTERPDSFLERFRGPANTDLQSPPSRFSHTHTGSEAENEVQPCSQCADPDLIHAAFLTLSVRRRKWKVVVLSPSDDAYYNWLIVIGAAVFYNFTLLVGDAACFLSVLLMTYLGTILIALLWKILLFSVMCIH
uniref:Uncharacterized protein n=1 Tax=Poecilia latipinna TaxID=48699 RepID=A0A3B3VGW8_9TELE